MNHSFGFCWSFVICLDGGGEGDNPTLLVLLLLYVEFDEVLLDRCGDWWLLCRELFGMFDTALLAVMADVVERRCRQRVDVGLEL